MKNRVIFLIGLLLVGLAVSARTAAQEQDQIKTGALAVGSAGFAEGAFQDVRVDDDGIVLAEEAIRGRYTSAVIESDFPFNALVPRWSADIPQGATLTVQIRTSKNGDHWSDWIQLLPNDDWMVPEDEDVLGQMIAVPGEDGTHSRLQYLVEFSRYAGQPSPILKELKATFFDSTHGPTADELVARQEAIDAEQIQESNGYPKPSVVGRSTWCTDQENCNYVDGLEYRSVSHLIVHHTVTGNSSADWAAIVRAIWRFHTFPDSPSCSGCRGWGDIGYNYLVDMNGVLYEGHLGGDDVIGTHAAGANAGSMALAFIGTFTAANQNPPGISPPLAMRNSAIELFAWKADQKDIDVHGSGYLPNVDWILPNLMGHRDVYGTTQCPGDQAYALLPWLRDQVAQRVTINTIYADELSAAFSKNDVPGWLVAPDNCGDNGHAYYAWSTQNQNATINRGKWRPNVSKGGFYELQAFVPYCITGAPETDGATYTITHANGESTVTISQEDHVRTWMSLGTYELAAGDSTVVKLSNLTQTDSNLGVWFDALRLVPANTCPMPSISNQSPPNAIWIKGRDITFSWQINSGQAIATTRLQIATDAEFKKMVFNQEFAGQKSSHAVNFAQDYQRLYWRVKVTTSCNQVVYSNIQYLGLDTTAPTSAVKSVYLMDDGRLIPYWSGNDSGVGIATYNIDYRADGEPTWIRWLSGYPYQSALFVPPDGREYWFRSQAIDGLGNVEPWLATPDFGTGDAIRVYRAIIFPLTLYE